MTLFWTLSVAMSLIALTIIAPALLRHKQTRRLDRNRQNILIARERLDELEQEHAQGALDDEAYAAQKAELEQTLLQDTAENNETEAASRRQYGKAALLGGVVMVPLVSVMLYNQLGTPAMLDKKASTPTTSKQHSSPHAGSLQQMAEKLHRRLEQQTPDDGDGWFLLGRTYMTMKDYPSAVDAFEHSYKLMSEDPGVMLALADAMSMTRGGAMQGTPAELVKKAFALEPDNSTAMWMAGLVAEDEGNYKHAIELWKKLLPRFAGAPQEQQQLNSQIARASVKAGLPVPKQPVLPAISSGTPAAQVMPVANKQTVSGASLKLKVSLSEALQKKARPDDTVFIYAKAMHGPRFPLAAVRHKASELPLTVTLDDTSAIMPAAKLSDFSQVKIGARVSHSGNAIAQGGDLIGERENIAVNSKKATTIVIDHIYD